jgi:signal transduction histidine kinase
LPPSHSLLFADIQIYFSYLFIITHSEAVIKNLYSKSNKQLEEANEQLKLQGKVQKEFVNVAAHELRTPIVPILNLSELFYTRLKRRELEESEQLQQLDRQRQLQQLQQEQQMIQVIIRNAYTDCINLQRIS